jgi:hypothetical protein
MTVLGDRTLDGTAGLARVVDVVIADITSPRQAEECRRRETGETANG